MPLLNTNYHLESVRKLLSLFPLLMVLQKEVEIVLVITELGWFILVYG